jgi:hypothetical protein
MINARLFGWRFVVLFLVGWAVAIATIIIGLVMLIRGDEAPPPDPTPQGSVIEPTAGQVSETATFLNSALAARYTGLAGRVPLPARALLDEQANTWHLDAAGEAGAVTSPAPAPPAAPERPVAESSTSEGPEVTAGASEVPERRGNGLTPYEAALVATGDEAWAQAWHAVTYCESKHNQNAVGAQGEVGHGQIHPTHRGLAQSLGYAWSQVSDPVVNAIMGAAIHATQGWEAWVHCSRQAGVR